MPEAGRVYWSNDINNGIWGEKKEKLTRQRYIKLTKIAREVCQLLDKKNLKAGEACQVREIAEKMIELEDK
jgi:hypothetical protein